MARKKGKAVSFDAMVKFFMQYYNIPTKKDVDRLMARIDRLENLIKKSVAYGRGRYAGNGERGRPAGARFTMTATDMVLEVVKRHKGIGFAEIQASTGFPEKKLRNIIYRLDKIGKIERKSRGVYVATTPPANTDSAEESSES